MISSCSVPCLASTVAALRGMLIARLRSPGAPWARRPLDGLNGAATAALSSTRWPEPPCQLLPRNKRALVPVPALRDRQPIDEIVRGLARMTCFVGLRRSLVRNMGGPEMAPPSPPRPGRPRATPAPPETPDLLALARLPGEPRENGHTLPDPR